MDRTIAHRARWVHPVVTAPLEDGAVLVCRGVVVGVGPWKEIAPSADDVCDHGDVWLVPGFVDAHAHLELTDHGSIAAPQGLLCWLAEVTRRSREMASEDPAGFGRAARRGGRMLRETGTAAVLDTTLWGVRADFEGLLIPAYEFLSYTNQEDERPFWRQAVERLEADAARGLPCALQPHALYTVHPDLIRRARETADRHHRLFAMHLCELAEEEELSAHATGPLSEMIAANGGRPADYGGRGESPIQRLAGLGVLDHAVLFHGNYIRPADFPLLLTHSASVVYCPRSHRHFGHARHPASAMLARGVNVCLGTDGLVSNEGLDMRAEMLCALDCCPGLSPDDALTMATLCGARALGIDGEYGGIAPGMRAAFAEIPEGAWPGHE